MGVGAGNVAESCRHIEVKSHEWSEPFAVMFQGQASGNGSPK